MLLVTGREMAEIDRRSIQDLTIPGIVLMENAGIRVAEIIEGILGGVEGKTVVILAGKGNNGGDGFVIARHLVNRSAEVELFLAAEQDQVKGDALINLSIWKNMGQKIYSLIKDTDLNLVRLAFMNADLVVDSIYGTGFKGTVNDRLGQVIEKVNSSGIPVVAVDIPSGLEADNGKVNGPCIRADHTVTFALPKLGLILPPGPNYVGKLHVVDISIPKATLEGMDKRRLLTAELVRGMMPRRAQTVHKGDLGRVLLIAGSRGMSGAAVLAAQAAARSGAGLITLGVPQGIHDIAEAKLTEVMTFPLPETTKGTIARSALKEILERSRKADVLALGPGLGQNNEISDLVKEIIINIQIPCVLDADGLNVMAGKTELFKLVKHGLVLTPHPGEMARLTGMGINQIQSNRLEFTIKKAKDWQCILLLKGVPTIVAGPDGAVYVNSTGNPGMASGGTGDVLTGVIAGLIGQGQEPTTAAATGAYLHGLAGDLAAKEKGLAGMLAGDLLDKIPMALQNFE